MRIPTICIRILRVCIPMHEACARMHAQNPNPENITEKQRKWGNLTTLHTSNINTK